MPRRKQDKAMKFSLVIFPKFYRACFGKKKEIASLTNQRTENPLLPLTATLKG